MNTSQPFAEHTWLNEPKNWHVDDNGLRLVTDNKTDFWRGTYYGFRRDNGHALLRQLTGDFTATATLSAPFTQLYDQAGLMLRAEEEVWLKTGVEVSDGVANLSAVVTRGQSDWSVLPAPDIGASVSVRATRLKDAIFVQYRTKDGDWRMLRLCSLTAAPIWVGPMACTPERAGLEVTFISFTVSDPVVQGIHDND